MIIQKESQMATAVQPTGCCEEDVVLNLTISGAREKILSLLDQMDTLSGFSVVKGSFVVTGPRNNTL